LWFIFTFHKYEIHCPTFTSNTPGYEPASDTSFSRICKKTEAFPPKKQADCKQALSLYSWIISNVARICQILSSADNDSDMIALRRRRKWKTYLTQLEENWSKVRLYVDLNPTEGSEQSGRRPSVILSGNLMKKVFWKVVIIAPLTYKNQKIIKETRFWNPSQKKRFEIWIR